MLNVVHADFATRAIPVANTYKWGIKVGLVADIRKNDFAENEELQDKDYNPYGYGFTTKGRLTSGIKVGLDINTHKRYGVCEKKAVIRVTQNGVRHPLIIISALTRFVKPKEIIHLEMDVTMDT